MDEKVVYDKENNILTLGDYEGGKIYSSIDSILEVKTNGTNVINCPETHFCLASYSGIKITGDGSLKLIGDGSVEYGVSVSLNEYSNFVNTTKGLIIENQSFELSGFHYAINVDNYEESMMDDVIIKGNVKISDSRVGIFSRGKVYIDGNLDIKNKYNGIFSYADVIVKSGNINIETSAYNEEDINSGGIVTLLSNIDIQGGNIEINAFEGVPALMALSLGDYSNISIANTLEVTDSKYNLHKFEGRIYGEDVNLTVYGLPTARLEYETDDYGDEIFTYADFASKLSIKSPENNDDNSNSSTPDVINPNTGDNVIMLIVIGIISLIGLGFTLKKVIRNN